MSAPRRRAMTPLAWVSVIASTAALIVGVTVWLGATNNPDGEPLIENPGGVIVALIGSVGLVASVAVPQLIQIKRHVENDHKNPDGTPIGLRDDLDKKFDRVDTGINGLASDIRGMRRDIGRLADLVHRHETRIDGLETAHQRRNP